MIKWPVLRWSGLTRGLSLSVLLHGFIVAGLLIALPLPEPETEPEEQVVEVTMVEPPEAPEPPPEPSPEPEPEAEAEPLQPEAEQSAEPEASAQAAPEPEQSQARDDAGAGEAAPIPVLRPVFRFGEEDSGPRLAPDGASAEEQAPPETAENEAAEPAESEAAEPEQPDAPGHQAEAPEAGPTGIAAPETAAPETSKNPGIGLPEISLPEAPLPGGALSYPDTDAAPVELSGPAADTPVEPDPSSGAPGTADPALVEAGELFSPVLTQNRAAMVAMGSLARGLRASQLCTTELREQLRNDSRRYGVELLPSYQLDEGNVLAVSDAAFRADGAWYNLSFRCTVDDEALRVVGFAHKVGAVIPPDQWTSRGFPSF